MRLGAPVGRWRAPFVAIAIAACHASADERGAWEPTTSSSSGDIAGTSAATSSDGSTSSGIADTTGGSTTGDEPEPAAPARYGETIHSPITPFVAERLQALRAADLIGLADDVFMKVGASSDVSAANLHCFATAEVDLGAHAQLGETLDVFLAGDAAGTTPFDRESLATEVGRTAAWATDGDPSPMQLEIDAIAPGLAFVHYGTNDMELGVDPGAALPGFHDALGELVDRLLEIGAVPMLIGMTRRGDDPDADRWVATYNHVLRAVAQQQQIPFIDAWRAIDPLPGHGLDPGGLHLEAYAGGPCIFTAQGLEHGYNVRNLIQLEALDRVVAGLGGDPPDDEDGLPAVAGDGSAMQPWQIDALPFVHDGDTTEGEALVDLYDCASTDESGPELTYAMELADATPLRIVVLDREGVDVDVHLQSTAEGCIARDDGILAGTVPAGSWRIVVDTWSDGAAAYPGRFILAVVPCDADDPGCAAAPGA